MDRFKKTLYWLVGLVAASNSAKFFRPTPSSYWVTVKNVFPMKYTCVVLFETCLYENRTHQRVGCECSHAEQNDFSIHFDTFPRKFSNSTLPFNNRWARLDEIWIVVGADVWQLTKINWFLKAFSFLELWSIMWTNYFKIFQRFRTFEAALN